MTFPKKSPQKLSTFSLRYFPVRYAGVISAFFLSIMMTCIVSLVSSIRAAGLNPDTLPLWLGAWRISWLIAFPVLLLVLPVVKRLTMLFIRHTN